MKMKEAFKILQRQVEEMRQLSEESSDYRRVMQAAYREAKRAVRAENESLSDVEVMSTVYIRHMNYVNQLGVETLQKLAQLTTAMNIGAFVEDELESLGIDVMLIPADGDIKEEFTKYLLRKKNNTNKNLN